MTITAMYLVRRRSEQARIAKQYAQMRKEIVDPGTGDTLMCKFRKCQANGFKACDECERLKLLVKLADTIQQKSIAEGEQIAHRKSVKRDREAVDNLRLRCIMQSNCVGFAIDAADSHKWPTPTTASRAKVTMCLYIYVCVYYCSNKYS